MRFTLERHFDADVIVVGGGPAGAAVAAHVAKGGADVLLLDRSTFPRDKVCGDFVGPVALVELADLGVSSRPEYQASNKIRDAALYLDGRKLIARALPEVPGLPRYGRVIPRLLLDAWMLDAARAAGADVLEGRRVSDFEVTASGVAVRVEGRNGPRVLRAQVLVGADGSGSTIARRVRGDRPSSLDRILAVRAYFDGTDGPSDQADLYFSSESFPGYCWLFPTGAGSANVGVGMLVSTLPPAADRLRELLMRLVERDHGLRARIGTGSLNGRVVGWPLTTFNHRAPMVSDRVVLVGDAAGLINPLNGEGIQYALQSGRWAAETILRALATDLSAQTLSDYTRVVSAALRYDMALANLIVQLIRNRHLNPVWLHALRLIVGRARTDPRYERIVGSVLAGLVPASDALGYKVVVGTIEQAAISLGVSAAWEAFKGPRHLSSVGLSLASGGVSMVRSTMRDPIATASWGRGVATGVLEVATQTARHRLMPPG